MSLLPKNGAESEINLALRYYCVRSVTNIWSVVTKIFSPTILLVIGLIFAIIRFVLWRIERAKLLELEKGYEIRLIPVITEDYAGIQIENIGTGELIVAARLTGVQWAQYPDLSQPLEKQNFDDISVHSLNPKGIYLGWGNSFQPSDRLQENIPAFLPLVSIETRNLHHIGDKQFVFAGYHKSPQIDSGFFKIRLKILRNKNGKWIDCKEFNRILLVDGNAMAWGK